MLYHSDLIVDLNEKLVCPWNSVLLEKLIVAQSFKELHFLLPCSQVLIPGKLNPVHVLALLL
jgi:hypothetical protein